MARGNRRAPRAVSSGPLAPFADHYGVRLRTIGYSDARSARRGDMARLSQGLERRRLSAADLGNEQLEKFLPELPP